MELYGEDSGALTDERRIAEKLSALSPGGDKLAEAPGALDAAQVAWVMGRIGPGPTAWALQEAEETIATVEASFPDVPDLPRPEIALSLETLLLDLLLVLIAPGSPRLAPSTTPAMAQAAARRDVPFAAIMESMRKVQRKWLAKMISESGAATLNWPMAEQLMSAGARIFDEEINRFVEAYLAERERLLENRVARRRAAVDALIAGEQLDTGQAQEDLGIDLHQSHTGMVFTVARSASGQQRERLVHHATRQLPKTSLLVLPEGRDHLWAWLSGPTPPTAEMLRGLRLEGPSMLTRWSIGQPGFGPEGFRRSHLQAQDLHVLFDIFGHPLSNPPTGGLPGLLWEDHALTALLGQSVERATWYVQARLGPLAEDSKPAEELRLTLLAYLDSGLSLVRAGHSRHVHRNTVVYRIQRIEELLTHRIKDRVLELHCALLLASHFGAAVLRRPQE